MKVLLNCQVPFMLTHGGAQIQIEQTHAALEKVGVTVEPLRWWDDQQAGDILHHFGRVPATLLHLARQKGMGVVMADLLTEQGSRSPGKLWRQRTITRLLRTVSRRDPFNWAPYRLADACIALTQWEAHLMSYLFGAPPDRVHVVPNGVEEAFFESAPANRGKWLICTATVTERKRVLETAQAAVHAGTPLWIIGKPYSEADPYAGAFLSLTANHPELIRYEGPLHDRKALASAYRAARGFVLLSAQESLSLSALEAAACECPLLLSDLPWARTVFRENASYCPVTTPARTADVLRKFYDAAPGLPVPPKPLSWLEVARQIQKVYERVLNTSR